MHELPPSSIDDEKLNLQNVLFFPRFNLLFVWFLSCFIVAWEKRHMAKKKGSTCFLNLVQEGWVGFLRKFNFPSEVEKFKSLSNKHQNGFVIFFNASPFIVKTMMNQDHHEKKTGVTIKLCFNSKRILHTNRTEGREMNLWSCKGNGWVAFFYSNEMVIQFFKGGFVCSTN